MRDKSRPYIPNCRFASAKGTPFSKNAALKGTARYLNDREGSGFSILAKMFKNLLGIFARVQELSSDPLLVKGFREAESIDELRYYKVFEKCGIKLFEDKIQYIGPERDLENRRKAFQAAKIRLGV